MSQSVKNITLSVTIIWIPFLSQQMDWISDKLPRQNHLDRNDQLVPQPQPARHNTVQMLPKRRRW